ncbi:MAG: glycosyl transferase family 1 [Rhodospirillales bacterium]|nr:glycosyl transferase family 1 [Rhodospirillales bacterium]
MSDIPLAFRYAGRELRHGLRGFGIFLACLTLGVAAIAGVGSLASAVDAGLKTDARSVLGGDAEFHLINREATPEQRAAISHGGTVSETAQMRAMARTADGGRRSLIELKAVDGAYPLYGAVTLDPAQDLPAALAERDGHWGAVVDPALLGRLGVKLGDTIRVGDGDFVIRAALTREPDLGGNMLVFGPRVMVSMAGLDATGLLQPGALVSHSYRLRAAPGIDLAPFVAKVVAAYPDAGWRVRDFHNATPSVEQFVDRVSMFLTLVGLTALLVGGVGIGNAVRGYLAGKTATIATLKCLGAPAGLIARVYLVQIMALALGGIVLGLVIGAVSPLFVARFIASELPAAARVGLYPQPLAVAAAFGILVTLGFSLWPLGRAREISAASLFRDLVAPEQRRPRPLYLAAIAAGGIALAGLAIFVSPERMIALWFVLGAAATLLAFQLAALLVMAAARRIRGVRRPGLRLALANLHRPGAPTASIILSLGIGLTVLVAIALIQGNLVREVREALPQAAPSYFFLDIQPNQVADFDRLMATTPGVTGFDRVPSLRGRIMQINGVPVDQVKVAPGARWAVASERGLTYAAKPPRGSRVVAGEWWPADYSGPPLISFDADLARGMGLAVGDTLTVNLLGRDVTARIANLRSIDWTSLGINFAIIFAPGTLEAAPQTHLATARTTPAAEQAVERAVTDRFPNVSAIRVKDALDAIAHILEQIGVAVRITAGITLAAGTLVLAGAVAAGHRRRVYDAVVLKVLGATRRDVGGVFLVEYGLLGLITAAIAGIIGSIAAYFLLTDVMHAGWAFLPAAVLGTAAVAVLLTLVIGFAGTWRALGVKPAPLLRNE